MKSNSIFSQYDTDKVIQDIDYFKSLIDDRTNWADFKDVDKIDKLKNSFTDLIKFRNELEDYDLHVKSLIKIVGEYINGDIKGMEEELNRFKKEYNQLETSLLYDYWEDNVSDIITYGNSMVFNKIAVRVKGIPINSEVLPEGFKLRILDDFVEGEYVYEIYIDKCDMYNDVDCIYQQFEDIITGLLRDMLTHDERNEIYNAHMYKQMSKVYELYPSNNYKLNISEEPLYRWQNEAYDAWAKNEYKGAFEVATGCGKTKFALYSIQKVKEVNNDIKVRIIVPTKALMNTWYDNLIMKLHIPQKCIGRKGNNYNERERHVTIYIDDTARNPEKFQNDFLRVIFDNNLREENFTNFIIADECHHYESIENIKMFKNIDLMPKYKGTPVNYYAIGLSATMPSEYNEKSKLKNYIGKIIYSYSFIKALEDGIISPINIVNVSYLLDEKERKEFFRRKNEFDKAYDKFEEVLQKNDIHIEKERLEYFAFGLLKKYSNEVEKLSKKKWELIDEYGNGWQEEYYEFLNANDKISEMLSFAMDYVYKLIRFRRVLFSAEDRKKKCIEIAKRHSEDKVIIFGEFIEDVDNIYLELVSEFGEDKVKHYHSMMSEKVKKEVLESLNLETTKIICVPTALDEGVDIPDMSVGIVYQGKKSQRQQVQRLGRIIRKALGKERAILYNLHNKKFYEHEFLDRFITEQMEEIKNMDNAAQILEIINGRLKIENI